MVDFKILSFDGCGGCQLKILDMQEDIVKLFDVFEYVGDEEAKGKVEIGIIIGYFSEEDLEKAFNTCDKIIICGQCANKSFLEYENKKADGSNSTYTGLGCPVDVRELLEIMQCITKDINFKNKNYPVCMECKALENVCLLQEGQKCYGPITYAGCNAKCTSVGVACRGCREIMEGADLDLMQQVWNENMHTSCIEGYCE